MGDHAYGRNKLLKELNYHRKNFSTKCIENFCLKQQEKYRRNLLQDKENFRPRIMQNKKEIYGEAKFKKEYVEKRTKNGKNRLKTEISHLRKDINSLTEQNRKQQILIDNLEQKLKDQTMENFSHISDSAFSNFDIKDCISETHSDYFSEGNSDFQNQDTEFWEESTFLALNWDQSNEFDTFDYHDSFDSNSDIWENSNLWDMERDCQTDFPENSPITTCEVQIYQPLSIDLIEKHHDLEQIETKMDILDEKGTIPIKIDHDFTKMNIFHGNRKVPIKIKKNETKMDILDEKGTIPMKIDLEFTKMDIFDGKRKLPIKNEKNHQKKAILTEIGQKPFKME